MRGSPPLEQPPQPELTDDKDRALGSKMAVVAIDGLTVNAARAVPSGAHRLAREQQPCTSGGRDGPQAREHGADVVLNLPRAGLASALANEGSIGPKSGVARADVMMSDRGRPHQDHLLAHRLKLTDGGLKILPTYRGPGSRLAVDDQSQGWEE